MADRPDEQRNMLIGLVVVLAIPAVVLAAWVLSTPWQAGWFTGVGANIATVVLVVRVVQFIRGKCAERRREAERAVNAAEEAAIQAEIAAERR